MLFVLDNRDSLTVCVNMRILNWISNISCIYLYYLYFSCISKANSINGDNSVGMWMRCLMAGCACRLSAFISSYKYKVALNGRKTQSRITLPVECTRPPIL